MAILTLFSALSGLVTVLSPCILPVLPIVLSSSVTGGKKHPLGVIAGLIVSFSLFTLIISRIISLMGFSANSLRIVSVIVIGILGIGLIIPAFNVWIERVLSRLPGLVRRRNSQVSGFDSGFVTGISLGLIWAPCAGPILAAVISVAASQALTLGVGLVVAAYATGAGLPLLVIAYGGRSLINRLPFLLRNTQKLRRSFGLMMVLTASLITFVTDILVTAWATNLVPASWTSQLVGFATSLAVTQKLLQLNQADPETAAIPPAGNPSSGAASGREWFRDHRRSHAGICL
jgi:cytochrome c biogenesis protein CcdA